MVQAEKQMRNEKPSRSRWETGMRPESMFGVNDHSLLSFHHSEKFENAASQTINPEPRPFIKGALWGRAVKVVGGKKIKEPRSKLRGVKCVIGKNKSDSILDLFL